MVYGYIRVSSKEQNVDRQADSFAEWGIATKNIFTDKQSGKDFERPAYKRLMKKIKKGDLLVVKSIDRLGRNYDEILEQWRIITKVKQADIFVIDFPLLDTRKKDNDLTGTFVSDLVLQILSYVAQTEREFIRQRQAEGIKAAKLRGVKFGRPTIGNSTDFSNIIKEYEEHKISLNEAIRKSNLSKATFYRKRRTYKLKIEQKNSFKKQTF